MPSIRTRQPFLAAFVIICLAAGYLGLSTDKIPSYGQSDKGLHFITFFLLTISFYWILEISRRRLIHLTLLTCTAALAIGSEILQALLPNGRAFDPFDILANVVGSGAALSACSWYHKRMLERKRKSKHYDIVPGEDGDVDLELGEQEVGVVRAEEGDAVAGAGVGGGGKKTVSEELDQWDENADDEWEEAGNGAAEVVKAEGEEDGKRRAD